MRHCALTIATTDCSGGAGIQADLKTFLANGVYGMSAIAALTAQNTCEVREIIKLSPRFLRTQLEVIWEDIPPQAIKIGMLFSQELMKETQAFLRDHEAVPLVIDPVMVSTSGAVLIDDAALDTLVHDLFPLATLLTPNLLEAEKLLDMTIRSREEMEEAARILYERTGVAVLIKGGHAIEEASDVLYDGEWTWFESERVENANTHGTGCTLSSAIAAHLAKGKSLCESIEAAKNYVTGALRQGLDLGRCSGPLDHGYMID